MNQKQAVATLYIVSGVLGLSAVMLATSGGAKAALFILALVICAVVAVRAICAPPSGPPPRRGGGQPNAGGRRENGGRRRRPPAKERGEAMDKLRVMSVFGTRPEAIKMAPLVKELAGREEIESLCCVTAQHREMLDSVLEVFHIKPDWDLNIMTPRQTLSTITSRCLTGMDEAIDALKPDLILVHGDTSTTFAGALSAFYHKVPGGPRGGGAADLRQILPLPGGDEPEAGVRHRGPLLLPHGEQPANLLREGVRRGCSSPGTR